METKRKNSFAKSFLWWGCGVATIIIAYWGIMRLIYKANFFKPWIEPNEFGDMFGFLSCLFSGLAFAGLIVTIKQQENNYNTQIQGINDTQKAQTHQINILEQQTSNLQTQLCLAKEQNIHVFFNSFIEKLLNTELKIRESIDPAGNPSPFIFQKGEKAAHIVYINARKATDLLVDAVARNQCHVSMIQGFFSSAMEILNVYKPFAYQLAFIFRYVEQSDFIEEKNKIALYNYIKNSIPASISKIFNIIIQDKTIHSTLPTYVKNLYSKNKARIQITQDFNSSYEEIMDCFLDSIEEGNWKTLTEEQRHYTDQRILGINVYKGPMP